MFQNPKAIVIGGSLGGLFAAIALRHIHYDVEIFEKSHSFINNLIYPNIGIILQIETINFLKRYKISPSDIEPALSCIQVTKKQRINKDGVIEGDQRISKLISS